MQLPVLPVWAVLAARNPNFQATTRPCEDNHCTLARHGAVSAQAAVQSTVIDVAFGSSRLHDFTRRCW